MKECSKCGIEKPTSFFNWKNKAKGQVQSRCKDCMKEYSKSHYKANSAAYKAKAKIATPAIRARNKAWLKAYLLAHPCGCGESDIEVLQFDHNDLRAVSGGVSVSSLLGASIVRLEQEIAACTVRCANCHYRRTRQQMGWTWD